MLELLHYVGFFEEFLGSREVRVDFTGFHRDGCDLVVPSLVGTLMYITELALPDDLAQLHLVSDYLVIASGWRRVISLLVHDLRVVLGQNRSRFTHILLRTVGAVLPVLGWMRVFSVPQRGVASGDQPAVAVDQIRQTLRLVQARAGYAKRFRRPSHPQFNARFRVLLAVRHERLN